MDTLDKAKLIEIAKKKLKDKKKIKFNSNTELINQFIISEKIKADEKTQIQAYLIYDRYESWSKANNHIILSVMKFFKIFSKFFERKSTSKGVLYFISPEGFNLHPTYVESVKKKRISDNDKKKKTKNKEEISSKE